MDTLSQDQRSRNMKSVKARDTWPEVKLRRILHALGLRFRLHAAKLPGKPDMVFPKYRTAVFVHGCFWHGHNCKLFQWPKTRRDFWTHKIRGNKKRDEHVLALLIQMGWRVLIVWECALKGPNRLPLADLGKHCKGFITSSGRCKHKELTYSAR